MLKAAGLLAIFCFALALQTLRANDKGRAIGEPVQHLEQRLIDLYRDLQDSVVKVKIATMSLDENGDEKVALTVLSGFYIDDQGTVLTNAIPLQDGPRIRIEQNGVQLLAVPIASDPRSNIALVQVAKPPANIQFIDLEQPAKTGAIGSLAYAITSPLDLDPTPKLGLVSGEESSFSDIIFPFTYTRISIASGPAEGGSPVFFADGSLMGISVASLPDVDSSYIVPTRFLKRIVSQLREKKRATHPSLGVRFSTRGNPAKMRADVIVAEVLNETSPDETGLLPGDVLLGFQKEPITDIDGLRDAIFLSEIGKYVSLQILRGDAEKEITLLLESR